MIGKRKLIVMLSALIFSLGVFSVGFGYWTDQLNLEGDANVNLSINVTDDIIKVEYTSPAALQMQDYTASPDNNGAGEGSVDSSVGSGISDNAAEQPADSSVPVDTEQNKPDGISTSSDINNPVDTTVTVESSIGPVSESAGQEGKQGCINCKRSRFIRYFRYRRNNHNTRISVFDVISQSRGCNN